MTRLTITVPSLLLAGLALSCSGTRASDEGVAALTLGDPASQASVGQVPKADADDKDCCDGEDDEDEADEQEVNVPLANVPRLVLDAAQAALPGFVASSAEMEQEDGQTVYSLSGTLDGEDIEIEISATGAVLEIERD